MKILRSNRKSTRNCCARYASILAGSLIQELNLSTIMKTIVFFLAYLQNWQWRLFVWTLLVLDYFLGHCFQFSSSLELCCLNVCCFYLQSTIEEQKRIRFVLL